MDYCCRRVENLGGAATRFQEYSVEADATQDATQDAMRRSIQIVPIEERSEIRSHSDPSQPSCLTDRQYKKYSLNNTTLQNTAGFIQDKLRRYRINLQVSPVYAAKHILAAFDV